MAKIDEPSDGYGNIDISDELLISDFTNPIDTIVVKSVSKFTR